MQVKRFTKFVPKPVLGQVTCVALIFALIATVMLVGCTSMAEDEASYEYDDGVVTTEVSTLPKMVIAGLVTDDLLPLRVAKQEGMLDTSGLGVEIVLYPSVEEKHAALVAGQADGIITDMVDAALLTDSGTIMHVVTVVQNIPFEVISYSAEITTTAHESLFEVPPGMINERVLAFSHDFLLGNTASGEATAPEASAEAIAILTPLIGQAVSKINAHPQDYLQLYMQQGEYVHGVHGYDEVPSYPIPDLPNRENDEVLLRWLFESGKTDELINYDDLIFIPGAP